MVEHMKRSTVMVAGCVAGGLLAGIAWADPTDHPDNAD
jgi:hypothetical protein